MNALQLVVALKVMLCFFATGHASHSGISTFTKDSRSDLSDLSSNSVLQQPVERVFSRKRRFLLMPVGGTLKFNASFSKRLLAVVPRGFNFIIELAFYYPTPGARIDLLPKRLRPPTTTTPKPKGPTVPTYIYIPGTDVRYKAKPYKKPAKINRIDSNMVPLTGALKHPAAPTVQTVWSKWNKYDSPAYEQRYEWTPAKEAQYTWRPAPDAKWRINDYDQHWRNLSSKWEYPERKWWQPKNKANVWPYHSRWTRDADEEVSCQECERLPHVEGAHEHAEIVPQYEPMYYPDLEEFDDSKHYHAHRDRRQLFDHFEGLSKILGVDMKSCVMRTICEVKLLLLPPGYSMVHDILRLVFSFPTISGLQDEYSRVMQSDYKTCNKYWSKRCHFNMLHWFLNPQKTNL